MDNRNDNMETLVSVMQKVESMGYVSQFEITEAGLHSIETGDIFQPDEVRVDHFYRFEGESSQGDNAILYAIETGSEKGTLVDGYGSSGDALVSEFMIKVEGIHK
jgi:hypothetical protein